MRSKYSHMYYHIDRASSSECVKLTFQRWEEKEAKMFISALRSRLSKRKQRARVELHFLIDRIQVHVTLK